MFSFFKKKFPPWRLDALIYNDNAGEDGAPYEQFYIYGFNPLIPTDFFGPYSKNNQDFIGNMYEDGHGIRLSLRHKESNFFSTITLEDSFNSQGRLKEEIFAECVKCDPKMNNIDINIAKSVMICNQHGRELSIEWMSKKISKRMIEAKSFNSKFTKQEMQEIDERINSLAENLSTNRYKKL